MQAREMGKSSGWIGKALIAKTIPSLIYPTNTTYNVVCRQYPTYNQQKANTTLEYHSQ